MYVAPAPTLAEMLRRVGNERVAAIMFPDNPVDWPRGYPHWNELRRRQPPEGLTPEEVWLHVKFTRNGQLKQLPLLDPDGRPFSFSLPDRALRLLHQVDQRSGGEVGMDAVVTSSKKAKRTFLVNATMEEAIRSSQLEGASTSRRVAKEMLRSGRPPGDRSERMIANNHAALLYAREEMGDELTPEAVLELQRILTTGTLDNPDSAGRLQRPDEVRVAVFDRQTERLLHRPPPAEQLPQRLQALCDFANAEDTDEAFLHPAVRAILLHFWLAYDHPFEDGNGRTARALFYWLMRRSGHWLVDYLSISRILREAPAQYSRSFLHTELDEGDTTYFILAQLEVMARAVDELHEYLARKVAEVQEVERLLRNTSGLNHRQVALLGDAVRNEEGRYTMRSHATSHDVTLETARADLRELADRGLLRQQKEGRRFVFVPAPAIARKLNTKSK